MWSAWSRYGGWPGSRRPLCPLVSVKLGAPVPTLHARIGNAFGWLCVAIAIAGAAAMISGRRVLRPAAPSVFP